MTMTVEERREQAKNLNILPETLMKLSVDQDDDVRLSVANNPSTPADIL